MTHFLAVDHVRQQTTAASSVVSVVVRVATSPRPASRVLERGVVRQADNTSNYRGRHSQQMATGTSPFSWYGRRDRARYDDDDDDDNEEDDDDDNDDDDQEQEHVDEKPCYIHHYSQVSVREVSTTRSRSTDLLTFIRTLQLLS
ncbi:hypothetical protein RRG08_002697 [Elysia crispata]|uniref:Uncharacterized protein n=1 Tax=Elysia crispata TaxID=231223 RepID=A0AAE0XTR8_9GAST|nr:hypothetical protein RRG08_002697 [Elysia crispata]